MKNISFLREILIKEYGEKITDQIMKNDKRKSTFRVNTLRIDTTKVKEILNQNQIIFEEVPWYKDAFIIENEEKVRSLDLYKEGKIYFQSLSSMLPAYLLHPKEKEQILDMAASPGGKTMFMYVLSFGKALITACEKNKIRYDKMKFNFDKQGMKNITTLCTDALKLDDFFSFDKILLDSPCSGSGTILLSDEKTYQYFTFDLIERCENLQYSLLKKAIHLLKPNHEMIYSTCSILKEENEEMIKKVLKEENIEIVPIDLDESIRTLPSTIEGVKTIFPNELYEGFFIAKIKKIS